jgi:hypothetical protein
VEPLLVVGVLAEQNSILNGESTTLATNRVVMVTVSKLICRSSWIDGPSRRARSATEAVPRSMTKSASCGDLSTP